MREIERWESDGNISCFADQLRYETNPARQEVLKRLLIEEENRFGANEDRLRMVERNLTRGAECIVRQKRLIAERKSDGGDIDSAERMLRTFEMIQDLFEKFRAHIYDGTERQRP